MASTHAAPANPDARHVDDVGELAVSRAILLLAAVFVPLIGLAYTIVLPHQWESLPQRLVFSALAVASVAATYISPWLERHMRTVVWLLITSFSIWFMVNAAVNAFVHERVMGLVMIMFCCSLLLRTTREALVYNGIMTVGPVALALAVSQPITHPVWLATALTTLGAFSTLAVHRRAQIVAQLAAQEEALRAAHDELERRVVERTAALRESLAVVEREVEERARAEARAQAANVAKSTFLANMSHELRTPLNAIIGYAELLRDEAEELGAETSLTDLDRILGAARHLLAMINDVLDLAKIEAGRMEVALGPVDVRGLIDEVVDAAGPQVREGGNRIVSEVPAGLPALRTDATRLRQVLVNLVANAGKFTTDGDVNIQVTTDTQTLRIAVCDTGCGIPADKLPALFDKFTQVDPTSTRRHQGTGLGLAICRELAVLLDGTLTATSVLGQGSCFVLELPWREPG